MLLSVQKENLFQVIILNKKVFSERIQGYIITLIFVLKNKETPDHA